MMNFYEVSKGEILHKANLLKRMQNPCYASIVVLKGISNDDLTFMYKLRDISPHQLTLRV